MRIEAKPVKIAIVTQARHFARGRGEGDIGNHTINIAIKTYGTPTNLGLWMQSLNTSATGRASNNHILIVVSGSTLILYIDSGIRRRLIDILIGKSEFKPIPHVHRSGLCTHRLNSDITFRTQFDLDIGLDTHYTRSTPCRDEYGIAPGI